MFKRHRTPKLIGLTTALATLAVAGAILAGCGSDSKTIFARPDWVQCVVNKKDGSIQTLLPGAGQIDVSSDSYVVPIPTSQRFINASNTAKRDPGMPYYITGQDSTHRPVIAEAETLLYFNQSHACTGGSAEGGGNDGFLAKHMLRNIPARVIDDASIFDKFGFNVRTLDDALAYWGLTIDQAVQSYGTNDRAELQEKMIAQVPWFKWFGENIARPMQNEAEPLLSRYPWEFFTLEYPVNGNRDGELPCKDKTKTVCADNEREPSAGIARHVLKDGYSRAVSAAITAKIDGQFFCGNTYDPAKPEDCKPVSAEFLSIKLDTRDPAMAEVLKNRQAQINLREQTVSDSRQAQLVADATAAKLEKQKADNDQSDQLQADQQAHDKVVHDQQLAAEYEKAQADAIQAKKLEDLKASNGGIDPAIVQAQQQAALQLIRDEADAAKLIAPCKAAGVSGADCVSLLQTLTGKFPPADNVYVGGQKVGAG